MARVLKIGTRSSPLAQVQAQHVRALLAAAGQDSVLVLMTTTGDRLTDQCLADLGGKALFTQEIEDALQKGTIDLAVHSLKDVETKRPPGLTLASVLARQDPRDVLIGTRPGGLETLPLGAKIGTSSARRAVQAHLLRPDLEIVPFRGNVGTRLEKLRAAQVEATFLAQAGLSRLKIFPDHVCLLAPDVLVPSAGQGALVLECLEENARLCTLLKTLEDPLTRACVDLERAFLEILEGDCHTPVGILVAPLEERFQSWIFVGTILGGPYQRHHEVADLKTLETNVLTKAAQIKQWLTCLNP